MFLNVKVPLIDPSPFLHRFFAKLKLKNEKILFFAMRLISRMKRDWIVVGRRPNNLCGAALVTASRIYGEERSVLEVAKAVRVSPHTINIRLKEMCDTQSANLTVSDFFNVWLEKEEDPPITKHKLKMVDDKTIESGMLTPTSDISEKDTLAIDENFLTKFDDSGTEESIDSDELECFILTKEEAMQKEKVWNSMYDNFLKERAVRASTRRREPKKRKPRETYDTVEEALRGVIKEKKMTNKINYEALKGLFD